MVMVYEGTPDQFSMDGYLKNALDTAKHVVKADWDMIFLYDGLEGVGKSVKAMQDAKYCDPNFNLEKIAFTPNAFRRCVINAPKYSSVVYDEAFTGLNSRATMSYINRALVQMLAEIRQKNLFIFVVAPAFHDFDKYVALHRSRALIHCYTAENFQRGYFAFYNIERKKQLFILGKKFYSYKEVKPNFIGRFSNHYVVDEQAYKKLKRDSLLNREQAREDSAALKELEVMMFNRIIETLEKLDPDAIKVHHKTRAEILGMPISTYWLKLRQWKEKGELEVPT